MMEEAQIMRSLHLLLEYAEKNKFRGFDPYDGLSSPVFQLPFIKHNHTLRFLGQQFIKRSPVNLRPLLGIKPGVNPVSLGLAIQSYSSLYLREALPSYREKAQHLIEQLITLIPSGYRGACWGYDFPWEARYASIPAYQPTVVATGIISNGLYMAYKVFNNTTARDLVVSSCSFVTENLNRTTDSDGSFCFSYSPFDHEKVFNASMKGTRLLSQGYEITGDSTFRKLAAKSADWVMKYQTAEGAWIYSKRNTGNWVDNYHTGYILDCLDEYIKCTHDPTYQEALQKGVQYYLSNFITEEGQPKFYNNEKWPADCTAAGQTLLSLTRFGYNQEAVKCALWMIKHMQAPEGNFYYHKNRYRTQKTGFMRWSDSWMLAGLSALSTFLEKKEDRL